MRLTRTGNIARRLLENRIRVNRGDRWGFNPDAPGKLDCMGINEAAEAIDTFLRSYDGGSGTPVDVKVHPSGDDLDVIKVWVDLGTKAVDRAAWEKAAAAAIRAALPDTRAFRLEVRAEVDRPSVQ
jgi:hypothetical protein